MKWKQKYRGQSDAPSFSELKGHMEDNRFHDELQINSDENIQVCHYSAISFPLISLMPSHKDNATSCTAT